jgi:dipeptidyl-peptidase 4
MKKIASSIIVCLYFFSSSLSSQKDITFEEIFTKSSLNPINLSRLQWITGSNTYSWVLNKNGEKLLRGNVKDNKVDTILKPSDINSELKRFPDIVWIDQNQFSFYDAKGFHIYNLSEKKIVNTISIDKDAENQEVAPLQKHVAFTINNNLFIASKDKTVNVSNESNINIISGKSVHREEFGISKGTFWSPNGNKLAFYRMDQTMVTDYPLVQLGTLPAKEKIIKYPMAGQKSHHVTLGVYDLASEKTIYIKTGEPEEQYLTNISWTPDEKFILIAIVNRAQNEMKLNQYNAIDGSFVKTLLTESDPQWIEPENAAQFIPGKNDQFIWQSERSGFNHLYLYDLSGKMIQQLSAGDAPVEQVVAISPDGKQIFMLLSTENGLNRKLVKTDLKGKMTFLTNENGMHTVQMSADGNYFIDNFSALTIPRRITTNAANGKILQTILTAPDPFQDTKLVKPELVNITAADGKTILNGRLFKPYNLEKGKKYPVVIYVYGGPHAQMVTNRWLGGGNNWMAWMASQGFVVFTVDNRGSASRGLEFEQVIHQNLGVNEMADQLKGVDYLKSLDFVDVNRIGVHGWSFGGFMTTTMLSKNPGMFKAGVAGGPVIDWKMYEIMYTERYMDTPQENEKGYENANLLNSAKMLKDRLMLIHGTVDPVVVWQHSQEMVKKCVEEGVLIDYMIYPEHEHNVSGKDRIHLMKTITRYLQEHL